MADGTGHEPGGTETNGRQRNPRNVIVIERLATFRAREPGTGEEPRTPHPWIAAVHPEVEPHEKDDNAGRGADPDVTDRIYSQPPRCRVRPRSERELETA
jgi:hypothetical protein